MNNEVVMQIQGNYIPSELMVIIFSYLPPEDLSVLPNCCKRFRYIINENEKMLWRQISIDLDLPARISCSNNLKRDTIAYIHQFNKSMWYHNEYVKCLAIQNIFEKFRILSRPPPIPKWLLKSIN
jgi:F-box-like